MSSSVHTPPDQQETPAGSHVRGLGKKSRLPARIRGWMHGWWSSTLDAIFPPGCLCCHEELSCHEELAELAEPIVGGPLLCFTCQQAMTSSWTNICIRCGNPWNEIAGECPCQRSRKLKFGRVVAMGLYRDHLRDAVIKIKQPTHDALAINLVRLLWDCWQPALAEWNIDLILPVPVSITKRIARGRGASEVIAEQLAGRLNCRWQRGVVRRRIGIPSQHGLPRSQRERNAGRAFKLASRYDVNNARVLLVDDVMTSGATCNAIGRLLLKAGAASVDVAVLARAMHG